MDTDKLFTRLGIMQTKGFKAVITFKNSKQPSFIAKVQGFLYDESDTKVVFKRCEETTFPSDTDVEKLDTFVCYIKDLKTVDRYHA